MPTLICFGFGYCAEHFVASISATNSSVSIGTVRGADRAAILNAYDRLNGCGPWYSTARSATPELARRDRRSGFALVSAPPGRRTAIRSWPLAAERCRQRETSARGGLSVDRRRLRRSRRRLGR